MTTKDLRDRYTEQKTLFKSSVERANLAKEQIQSLLAQIDMDFVGELYETKSIDLTALKTLDLDKLQTDSDYFNSTKQQLGAGIVQLQRYIEDTLHV